MSDSNKIQDFNPSADGGNLSSEQVTELLKTTCHYVDYVEYTKNSKNQLVALIFPNKALLNKPDYQKTPEEGCFCPRNLDEVGKCLTGCLKIANKDLITKSTPISLAIIVGEKFTQEDGKLTAVGKEKLLTLIEQHKNQQSSNDDVYIIDLE